VHFIWRGGHDSLFWLSQNPLYIMETKESTRIIDNEMIAFTERFMLPDRVSHSAEMPWIPFVDGCLFTLAIFIG
jgi:hypothetical protein